MIEFFIESLKRLYSADKKIDKAKLDELLKNKKISKDEYDYITNNRDHI